MKPKIECDKPPAWLVEQIPCPKCQASEDIPHCNQCLGGGWVWSGTTDATCDHPWDVRNPTRWACRRCGRAAAWLQGKEDEMRLDFYVPVGFG